MGTWLPNSQLEGGVFMHTSAHRLLSPSSSHDYSCCLTVYTRLVEAASGESYREREREERPDVLNIYDVHAGGRIVCARTRISFSFLFALIILKIEYRRNVSAMVRLCQRCCVCWCRRSRRNIPKRKKGLERSSGGRTVKAGRLCAYEFMHAFR